MRSDSLWTMPPRLMTAMSVVPPPMSATRLPFGLLMSRPAPMAAATGSNVAAGFQLATGYPVMPIGGFNGSDPSPTLAQFEKYVRAGEIHWYVVSPVNHSNGGSSSSAKISDWVTTNYTPITMGGIRFYDLTKPLA